jgi:DNA invertase Pin-like site-specific DNA recombinase
LASDTSRVVCVVEEFERDLIRERTLAGLEAALAATMHANRSTLNEIASVLGVSRSTVIRMLAPSDTG